jgi:hypothetical protein
MAGGSQQREQADGAKTKPLSDMDPEGMDSEFEGDDLDSSDRNEEEDEDTQQSTPSRPEHNRRESDRDRVSPSGDRKR